MKKLRLLTSTISKILFVVMASFIFISCSKTDVQNNEETSQNYNLTDVNKGNGPQKIEYMNKIYSPQTDDFVQIKISNDSSYFVKLDTQIEFRKSQTGTTYQDNIYEIKNPETNEMVFVQNIRNLNNYCLFDLKTSEGHLLTDIKYLGTDFTEGLDSISITNGKAACPWCYVAVTVIGVLIDSMQETPLQQCTAAMNSLNCPNGQSPYMNFSEGWFSTTCSVGCKR